MDQVIDPVLALCAAASDTGGPPEVGGGAIDHFVDGRLESCTNVAQGQPATQSSVAYGGTAEKAVDGNGFAFNLFSRLFFALSLSFSLTLLVRHFAYSRSHFRSFLGQAGRQLGVRLVHAHNKRRADLVAGRSLSSISTSLRLMSSECGLAGGSGRSQGRQGSPACEPRRLVRVSHAMHCLRFSSVLSLTFGSLFHSRWLTDGHDWGTAAKTGWLGRASSSARPPIIPRPRRRTVVRAP